MSHPFAMGLAIFCVCLTAAAQVMLRAGMSSAALQAAMAQGIFSLELYRQAFASPLIWGGIACCSAAEDMPARSMTWATAVRQTQKIARPMAKG